MSHPTTSAHGGSQAHGSRQGARSHVESGGGSVAGGAGSKAGGASGMAAIPEEGAAGSESQHLAIQMNGGSPGGISIDGSPGLDSPASPTGVDGEGYGTAGEGYGTADAQQ